MGKGNRLKKMRRKSSKSQSDKASDVFTRNFQKEIRNSEIWDQMVEQFGEDRALELLNECKAEFKTNMFEK